MKSLSCRMHLLLSLLVFSTLTEAASAGHLRHHCYCCPTSCKTVYHNGDADGALTIHVAGFHKSELQVFFRHQYSSDRFKHHTNLHCNAQADFFPGNDRYATFSLRYGDGYCKNRFALYGVPAPLNDKYLVKITNDPNEIDTSLIPRTYYVATDDGYPVRIEWISTQVAKISHGPSYSKTIVLRFLPDNDGEWHSLDGTTVEKQ